MYSNIGKSIKIMSKILLVIGLVLSLASCIISLKIGDDINLLFSFLGGPEIDYRISAFGYLILGSFFSFLISFLIYGFGEIIESVQNIEYKVSETHYSQSQSVQTSYKPEPPKVPFYQNTNNADNDLPFMVFCTQCGRKRAANLSKCPHCGYEE